MKEEKGTNAEKESDELLQKALINFPLILSPLLTKCNKSLHYPDKPSQKINFEIEPFFSAPYSPPSLTKLATLFIDKNYSLWTDQKVFFYFQLLKYYYIYFLLLSLS